MDNDRKIGAHGNQHARWGAWSSKHQPHLGHSHSHGHSQHPSLFGFWPSRNGSSSSSSYTGDSHHHRGILGF